MKILNIIIIFCKMFLVQGCAAITISSIAAIATKSIIDPRTIGTQLDDSTLELRVINEFSKINKIKNYSRIIPTVYKKTLLLTGQASNKEISKYAKKIAMNVNGISKVYNEIRIKKNVNLLTSSNDLLITAKIRAKLISNNQIKSSNIKIITEDSEVFLLGILTSKESEIVANIASRINGVKHVIMMFNIY